MKPQPISKDLATARINGVHAPRANLDGAAPPRRFKLLSVADVRAMPPMRWRVQGVLPEEGFAAIFGASSSGKGFLVFQLAAAIADGADFFGHRTTKARVIYVCLEGQSGVQKRIAAYEHDSGRAFPDGVQFIFGSFKLTDREDVLTMAATIAESAGADVVIVDTLNRAAPGADENNSRDMGLVLESIKDLQGMVGGLILLVHHAGKDAARGMRGHSSIFAALDAVIEVNRTDESREWSLLKSKDGRDGEAHPFRLQVVQLGDNEFGEPVTSCVVDAALLDRPDRRLALPKGDNQRIIFEALGPLFRESFQRGKGGAPDGRPCLLLEQTVELVRERLAVTPKRRTERALAAINGLVASGLLNLNEGWIWLA